MARKIGDFDQVLSRARSGDSAAVTCLYDALQPSLLGYLRWQEPSMADDLAGETWLAVAERLSGFTGDEGAFRAWIFAIARRRVADHRRRSARRPTVALPHDSLADVRDTTDPEGEVLDSIATHRALQVLSDTLSRDQAEVVVLRVLGGLSVDETARVLSKRPGSIRVLQHRALRRLAARLPDHDAVEV